MLKRRRSPLRRTREATVVGLFLLLLVLTQPSSVAISGIAEVSPGKMPRKGAPDKDHYLGNGSYQIKLEYPRSFILQETVGDLLFNITGREKWRSIDVYIPPEFKIVTNTSYVWSTVTNNYTDIAITKSAYDRIAPSWYRVSVTNGTFSIGPGSHLVRVFSVTAPSIVGRYFFKVFLNGTSITPGNCTGFPSVVVAADPNPAYISGTVKYGGRMETYGSRLRLNASAGEGGKVFATGITSDGRRVVGQAFFNSTCEYTLYGLAAGRYQINATAARYAPADLPYQVTLKEGQSLEQLDIFLLRSPILSIMALSRRSRQAAPWGYNATVSRRITFEILDYSNTTVRLENVTTNGNLSYHNYTYYGARDLDGHIPQVNSGFSAGIGPGIYYVKAWVNGYIQRDECMVVFTQNEQDRLIYLPLDRSGSLRLVVHFTDSCNMRLLESPTPFNGILRVDLYDNNGTRYAANSVFVAAGSRTASIELTGLVNTERDYGIPSGTYIVFARLTSIDSRYQYVMRLFRISGATIVFLSSGGTFLYWLYPQPPFEHRVTMGEGEHEISVYMLLQGGLNFTIFSATAQRPFSLTRWKNWKQNFSMTVEVRDVYGVEVYSRFRIWQRNATSVNATLFGLDDGTYSIYVFTYGYYQRQIVFFNVNKCVLSDVSVVMVEGVEIMVALVFQKQRIISPIDTYINPSKVPVRFEVFDSKWQFVGANATYIYAEKQTVFTTTLKGFRSYYGNTTTRWVNYYDATDGASQRDYGLTPDIYTVKVYIPGYSLQSDLIIDARTRGGVSVIATLHRLGHLCGMVHTYSTHFANYTRISWVSVDVLGEDTVLGTCTLDGFYEAWVNPGSYLVMYSLPGYQTISLRLQIPDGSDVRRDLQLLPFQTSARASMGGSAGSSPPAFPLPHTAASPAKLVLSREQA